MTGQRPPGNQPHYHTTWGCKPRSRAVLLGPLTPLPGCPFPVKCLALSTRVSSQTIHFWAFDKRPHSALEGVTLPAAIRYWEESLIWGSERWNIKQLFKPRIRGWMFDDIAYVWHSKWKRQSSVYSLVLLLYKNYIYTEKGLERYTNTAKGKMLATELQFPLSCASVWSKFS